jgi:hypothetical protein
MEQYAANGFVLVGCAHLTFSRHCLERELELNRSAHHWDEGNRSIGVRPESPESRRIPVALALEDLHDRDALAVLGRNGFDLTNSRIARPRRWLGRRESLDDRAGCGFCPCSRQPHRWQAAVMCRKHA